MSLRIVGVAMGMLLFTGAAPAALVGPGDLAFTGFNADGDDDFAVVALEEIAEDTIVFFTDRNWTGSTFDGFEGTLEWKATGGPVAAGTVLQFSDVAGTESASAGTILAVSGTFNLSGSGDAIYAFLNSPSSPTFLAAIANDTGAVDLTGTGLSDGTTAQVISGDEDVMAYSGPRSGQTSFAGYLSLIGDDANWITQDGTGDQSADGDAPDSPFDATAFTTSPIPEPSSLTTFAALAICFALVCRRRRRGRR